MKEYALKFIKLSKYTPFMVSDPRAGISKFVIGVTNLMSLECKTVMMLIKKIDISRLITYGEQLKMRK